jgi:hypothetical protein
MQCREVFLLVIFLVLIVLVAHVFACDRASREQLIVGGAAGFTHRLLPAGKTPHHHLATLDSRGEGVSTVDRGHSHRVHGYKTEPSGPDAHVHNIMQYVVEA